MSRCCALPLHTAIYPNFFLQKNNSIVESLAAIKCIIASNDVSNAAGEVNYVDVLN